MSLVPYKMCPTSGHKHTTDGALEVPLLDFKVCRLLPVLALVTTTHQGLSPDPPGAGNSVSSQANHWCGRPASLTSGGPALLNRLLICLGKAGRLGRESWGCALSRAAAARSFDF